MKLKKLAFIDHSFHKKSNATDFFVKLLKKHYRVDIYWDESWQKKSKPEMSRLYKEKYDIVILFQTMHSRVEDILSIGCENIIIVPMHDAVLSLSDSCWLKYSNFKFLNFSKNLHDYLIKLGLNSQYFQYFPDPDSFKCENIMFDSLKGFFWQRTDDISWKHIRLLIKYAQFSNFHLHNAVDPPGYSFVKPSAKDIDKYQITISQWFEKQKDYLSAVSKSNIYFAPRLYEGIGMSYLEAMAQGKCVVAPDNPTMNEYITHGVTGYLYDINNLRPIEFSDAGRVGINARESIIKGYEKWSALQKELINFIEQQETLFVSSIGSSLKKINQLLSRTDKNSYNKNKERLKYLVETLISESKKTGDQVSRYITLRNNLINEILKFQNSYSYRLGKTILKPFIIVRNMFRKLKLRFPLFFLKK